MLAALLTGCLEVVEHAPVGACNLDSDCGCNLECQVTDAGDDFRRCGPRLSHGCTIDHDCAARPDSGFSHCLAVTRDAGDCGYKICQ